MAKKKITSVDDLEVGKCYKQGKGFYFRFLGKNKNGGVSGFLLEYSKHYVHAEQQLEIPLLGDLKIKEVSNEKFLTALGKAMHKFTKIAENIAIDLAVYQVQNEENC